MGAELTREDAYWILNGLPSIGPVSANRLLRHFADDPCAIFVADESELQAVEGLTSKARASVLDWKRHFDLAKERERTVSMGAVFISRENSRYPKLLKEIYDPPIGLYVLGNYDFDRPSVAIVGSRRTTLYGQSVAREFAQELAGRGFCVTSGLARGIDTFAHKGALATEGGATAAVLGCGLDIIYPPENLSLYREIQDNGAVVSEFVLGRRADKQTFPMRNRLVSGMSEAVIVVESDASGGSMITARFAGEQGRLLCAIPGRIDQKTSRGCHQLLRDGATLLTSVDDLLDELRYESLQPELPIRSDGPDLSVLNIAERSVFEQFDGGEALQTDAIIERLSMPASEVSSVLMMLEIKGFVAKRLDGCYEATVGAL